MANTLSLMTNAIRNVVSKQRIRYTENGFNLDLAYICENIIAMGYPADNIEGIYRNHIDNVYQFFDSNHRDNYKIYNLCSERSYDVNKFHGRVAVYPFDDHNPPTIELIQNFCDDVDRWLKEDKKNVAAVHCKAGKGRTGTMICCYLLHSGFKTTAEEVLAYYDEKRTRDRKGVTIPSQRRYVDYYSRLIRSGQPYEKRTVQICEIKFSSPLSFHSQGSVHCVISVISSLQDLSNTDKCQTLQTFNIDFRKSHNIEINDRLPLTGDVKIEVFHKVMRKKEKYFHFWFNTYFVCDDAVCVEDGDETKLVYELSKHELDDAHKDKEHKIFPEDFKVQVIFRNLPQRGYIQTNENSYNNHQIVHNQQQKQNQIQYNNSQTSVHMRHSKINSTTTRPIIEPIGINEDLTSGILSTDNCSGNNLIHQFNHQNHQHHQHHRHNRQHHHYQPQQQQLQQQQQQPQPQSQPQQRQQHQLQQQQQHIQQKELQQNQQQQQQQPPQLNHNYNHNVSEYVGYSPPNDEQTKFKGQSQKQELSFHENSNDVNIRETPSVSPDVSRSNSSSGSSNSSNSGDASTIGEDWESGEFVIKPKSKMMTDDKPNHPIISNNLISKRNNSRFKVRRKKNNLNINSSFSNKTTVIASNSYSNHSTSSSKLISITNKSTPQQFKIKSNNTKISSGHHIINMNNNNKKSKRKVFRKMRWLSNMKSDPDLCETIAKSVNFRNKIKQKSEILFDPNSHNSNTLNEFDYYSSLCDTQLSFDISPSKSPFNMILANKPRDQYQLSLHSHESNKEKNEQDTKDIAMNKLVVAKPIESHSIGFLVLNDKTSNNDKNMGQNLITKFNKSNDNISDNNTIIKNEIDSCCSAIGTASTGGDICKKPIVCNNLNSEQAICDTAQSLMMLSTITSSSPPARMSNRCVPFSFKEIRQELQSVIKQNTSKSKSNSNENTNDGNNGNYTRFSLVGANKKKNSLPSNSSSSSSSMMINNDNSSNDRDRIKDT